MKRYNDSTRYGVVNVDDAVAVGRDRLDGKRLRVDRSKPPLALALAAIYVHGVFVSHAQKQEATGWPVASVLEKEA